MISFVKGKTEISPDLPDRWTPGGYSSNSGNSGDTILNYVNSGDTILNSGDTILNYVNSVNSGDTILNY